MTPALNEIGEHVELKIGRFHLQILGAITSLLLTLMGYFLYKTADQLEKLTDNVTRFSTYQQVNDLRQITLDGKVSTLERDIDKKDDRIKALEDKVLILEYGKNRRPD